MVVSNVLRLLDGNFTATEITGNPVSTITYSHAPGSLFPVGTTTVTVTATNTVGISTKTFKVTVTDNEVPKITVPADVNVNPDNGSTSATNVNLGTAVTSDNCTVASVTNDAPSAFPTGATTVTWTVNDTHGNRLL